MASTSNDLSGKHLMKKRKRVGIFGWGLVAPKSPNVKKFEENLGHASSWLEPFKDFGPSNFLVGQPDFNFEDYKAWINDHFEPRKYSQLDAKMGDAVKFAIGSYIQALEINPGIRQVMSELGQQAHVYVGTGLGDLSVSYDASLSYYRSKRRWDKFWCKPIHHPILRAYAEASEDERASMRATYGAPQDPGELDPESEAFDDLRDDWYDFWSHHSEGLQEYLGKLRDIESESIVGDVDSGKGHVIRRKIAARRKLNKAYGCPTEPWGGVEAKLLWNIANIAGAQISMLGKITGTCVAPIAACSGFTAALKLADNAIQLGEAKVAVVGMTDPRPHPLSVAAFHDARVISNDRGVSKPFTGLRGTHIAGGACVWIVGDYDYLTGLGMKPIGLEICGIGLNADAHHIITPSAEGPKGAIQNALAQAEVSAAQIDTWDMHATATPGDWLELQNALALFSDGALYTARKGSFGHGMSVCGGWELTAQHLGMMNGQIYPVNLEEDEIHGHIRPYAKQLVRNETLPFDGRWAGKINMGVGGINGCLICRRWPDDDN